MSLVITQRPQQTISGETSNWNAVGNPIVYKLQRKDFIFDQVNNNAGSVQLQFNAVDLTSDFTVGDQVYLKSDNGTYDVFGNVTAKSFSTNTLITINVTHAGVAPGGFLNNETSHPLYRANINLYDADDSLINVEPFTYSANSKGLFTVNVSTIAKTNLIADNDMVIGTDEVYEDSNIYQEFYLGYTEIWTGSAESEETDDSNVLFAVFGALQIPSAFGGNMAEYVTFDDGTPQGKFLTKFDSLTMWRGYPFLISAIIGTEITDNVFITDGSEESTPDDFPGKIIMFDLNEVFTDQSNDQLEVFLNDVNAELIPGKIVNLKDACDNPVMLLARNSLGGPLQWLFDHSQEYTHNYDDGRKAKRLILTAENLTINEWESLQDFITLGDVYKNNIIEFDSSVIKSSSKVGQQVYQVFPDGSKIGVIAIPTLNSTQTRNVKHRFEIEIEYPEEFVP